MRQVERLLNLAACGKRRARRSPEYRQAELSFPRLSWIQDDEFQLRWSRPLFLDCDQAAPVVADRRPDCNFHATVFVFISCNLSILVWLAEQSALKCSAGVIPPPPMLWACEDSALA